MPNHCFAAQIFSSLFLLLAAAGPVRAQSGETAAPQVTADDKGLGVKSADGLFSYRLRGLLQVDSRWFLGDDDLDDKDSFLLRRARPMLEATVLEIVDLRLVPDFGEGDVDIDDAVIDVRSWSWLKLRLGKFKPPIGLERLQSDADMPLLERGLTSNLSPSRDVGAQLFGELLAGIVHYEIGVFNGAVDNASDDTDKNHAKDFAGRVFVQPFATATWLGTLGLGVSLSTGKQSGTTSAPDLPTYKSAGQNAFFNYLTSSSDPNGTVIADGRRSRLNPELYYYLGGAGLLVEYIANRQNVSKGSDAADLTHHAWQATLSFALGGKTCFDGVTPTHSYKSSPGGWGAAELAGRISYLKLDDDTFPTYADDATTPREATGYGVALSWHPSRNARIAVQYERTNYDGAPSPTRTHEDALITRGQVTF